MLLKEFKELVLPLLADKHKGDPEGFKKAVASMLKQGEEEAVPVMNEDGEPVEIEEIILVGAPSSEEPEEEEPEEAPLTEMALTNIVRKEISDAMSKSEPVNRRMIMPETKAMQVPAQAKRHIGRLKCFKGQDAEWKAFGFGTFCHWLTTGNRKSADWLSSNVAGFKAMSEGSNIAGGAFVPEEFSTDLIRLVEEFGVFRANARTVGMTRDTLVIPRRTSGLTAYAVGENTAITASDLGTDNVELTARKWATLTRISSELMEDSAINIGDLIGTEIAQAFADKEDDSGFNGDGTSTFHGIFGAAVKIDDGNHTASISTAATGNTAFSTLDLADFHSLTGLLPRYAIGNARWYISAAGFADSMQRLAHAQGGVTRVETEAGSELAFLGYPVVISQKMNSTLTAETATIKLLFGDLSLSSTFGDRKSIEVMTSTDRYFDQDQVAIRGIERIDIVNHDLGDTTDAGPLVALKTPAS